MGDVLHRCWMGCSARSAATAADRAHGHQRAWASSCWCSCSAWATAEQRMHATSRATRPPAGCREQDLEPHAGYDIAGASFENRDYDAAKRRRHRPITGRASPAPTASNTMVTKRGGKANFSVNAGTPTRSPEACRWWPGASDRVDVRDKRKSVGRSPGRRFLFEPGEPDRRAGSWLAACRSDRRRVQRSERAGAGAPDTSHPDGAARVQRRGSDRLSFTVGDAGPAEAQAIIDTVVGQLPSGTSLADGSPGGARPTTSSSSSASRCCSDHLVLRVPDRDGRSPRASSGLEHHDRGEGADEGDRRAQGDRATRARSS